MDERELLQYRASILHYRDGVTMDAIACQLGVSRSTVSRLLRDARDAGLVRIEILEPRRASPEMLAAGEAFGVEVVEVPVWAQHSELGRLNAVASAAAQLLSDWMFATQGGSVGLAWGTTVRAVVSKLARIDCEATVVQLNGAANPASTGVPYAGGMLADAAEAWSGEVVEFPVPAFFDYAATKEAMWRERSIQRVLAKQDAVDTAVFGVGAFGSPVPSHVYTGGYLDRPQVVKLLEEGVVGDVCTVMLRGDGTDRGISLNERASGMTPARLRRIPRRLCVAAGVAKADGVVAALRAHVVTHLIIDSDLGRAVARRLEA